MKNLEVLAPAGSYDSMLAAVRCGANAIYLGGRQFSARTNARNFNYEELKSTVKYCHERKIKNTQISLAYNNGLNDGISEGISQGIAEGISQGIVFLPYSHITN